MPQLRGNEPILGLNIYSLFTISIDFLYYFYLYFLKPNVLMVF
jgi:hypothetical protein